MPGDAAQHREPVPLGRHVAGEHQPHRRAHCPDAQDEALGQELHVNRPE